MPASVPSNGTTPKKFARKCRVELHMETIGRKELVRWVLTWMPEVRVLAPQSLRDRIALKLEEGLRRQTETRTGESTSSDRRRQGARGAAIPVRDNRTRK